MSSERDSEQSAPGAEGQGPGQQKSGLAVGSGGTVATSKRQALRDLRRQLSEADLASPGVQKMILDALEASDAECEDLKGYVTRYHDADKHAAVLEEKLRTHKALEIVFGVGVGLGGVIIGFVPTLWNSQPIGIIALAVGALLIAGAIAARVAKQ